MYLFKWLIFSIGSKKGPDLAGIYSWIWIIIEIRYETINIHPIVETLKREEIWIIWSTRLNIINHFDTACIVVCRFIGTKFYRKRRFISRFRWQCWCRRIGICSCTRVIEQSIDRCPSGQNSKTYGGSGTFQTNCFHSKWKFGHHGTTEREGTYP